MIIIIANHSLLLREEVRMCRKVLLGRILLLLSFYSLLLVSKANSIVKPCDNMTSTNDESFLRANLYTMHNNLEEFFKHDVTKDCNLHYIDIHKVQPRKGTKSTWILYLGDSIAHDLYVAAVQRLTGFDHSANQEEVTKGTLGGHLGPQTEERINKLRYVNNPEYLVCCRAWYRPVGDGDKGKTNECLFAGARKMAGKYAYIYIHIYMCV